MPDIFSKICACLLVISLMSRFGMVSFAQKTDGNKAAAQNDTLFSSQPDTLIKELPVEIQQFIETITTENESVESEEPQLEIDGLVVDETRTKAGHDFYDQFYSMWEAPPQAKNFSILIRELPFRVNITQIQILVNDELVVNSILQPKQDFISDLANQAVPVIGEYLIQLQEMARQLDDADLSGSGIY